MQHCFHVVFYIIGTQYCMLGILEKISPSELVSNGYISNHNKVRRPRPKFKVSFYWYFCCFWINVNSNKLVKTSKVNIQRIISDSCFQLKSWFNVDARAPSIPLLNFPFNLLGDRWHVGYYPFPKVRDKRIKLLTIDLYIVIKSFAHYLGVIFLDQGQGEKWLTLPNRVLLFGWQTKRKNKTKQTKSFHPHCCPLRFFFSWVHQNSRVTCASAPLDSFYS